ncbi:hypothetical protein IGI04_041850 [Brassica rapa subsp. trilocularis]|uniref:RRM domain-containing protein n=1 Tax=Brassica rapa subsp. trilocularis TaxID=1813537 RepID=A0ABQ7KSN3_BRACM|nr:hypothetical protein IGI04_041850 [Brassica rapa subsp. trilocularis]
MERSAIKGMSQLTLNESDTKKTRPRKRDIGRICVRGYNTDLPHNDVVNALRKHFSSCGEITDVYIFEKIDGLHSFGFIYFLGEGAVDKALQLSGIDVGGWTVIAEPYPYPAVIVQGYDTLLDNADIEKMLFEHFSSYAEVTEIRVHKRSIGAAVVELYGEDAEQKVMDLDGSIMVGRKISVKLYTAPTVYSVHPRRRRNRNYYPEMSLLTLNERDTTKRTTRPRKRDIGRVRVMGYNIDLPQDDVESALRNHFSSCGKITDVCVIVLDDNMLDSFGFIYFLGGQGTVDRVTGRCNLVELTLEDGMSLDPVAIVQGYDTCLGKTDIKRMLFDHFSSCGQIKDIMFQRSSIGVASVYLYGEGAEDKVLDLDGSYMGGCKILVKLIPSSGIYTVHPRSRHLGWPSPILAMSSRPPGMSLLTLNENDAKKNRPKNSYIGRILVKGYNTQLSHDDVESSLRKLFSSCGEITDVYISVLADNTLDSFGFVYFLGEGAVDKALQLSGSDMGGWTVIAEPHPFPEDADCDPVVAVQGYDTSLSKSDIKKVLTTHFSSCGEVTEIRIHKKIGAAAVCVYGECAEEKVQDLDGSYIGEHKITVRLISAREIYSVHPRRRYRCPFPDNKANMTSEE